MGHFKGIELKLLQGMTNTKIDELIIRIKIAFIDSENLYNLLCLVVVILATTISPLFFAILLLDVIKRSKKV